MFFASNNMFEWNINLVLFSRSLLDMQKDPSDQSLQSQRLTKFDVCGFDFHTGEYQMKHAKYRNFVEKA